MGVELKTKIEKRANLWSQMQELRSEVDAAGDFGAEQRAKWDAMDAEMVTLNGDIERLKDFDEFSVDFSKVDRSGVPGLGDARTGDPKDEKDAYRSAFVNTVRWGLMSDRVSPEERALVRKAATSLPEEARTMGVTSAAGGGYLVPDGFWAKITETLKYYAEISNVATVFNTESGAPIPWPTNDDTANVATLLGEGTAVTMTDLSLGQRNLGAFTFHTGLTLSILLLQDAGVDIEGYIAKKLGQRLGRGVNAYFTTGTGTGQPLGYITGGTSGRSAASATAISYDDIVYLLHSVDVAYRAPGKCRFALHDSILAQIRLLKDSQNRPLWQPAVAADVPDTLLGQPYFVNNFMDSTMASGKKTVAFGDFESAYVVRHAGGAQMLRLEERYAEYLQVGFILFARMDGMVQDTAAVKYITH